MLNQRRNFMTGDEPKHLNAVVDTVRFASRDNPITEIKLRTGRGGSLKNSLTDIEEQEEDTGLPVIIGGTNASGKTSLLRGIQEVCNLLQLSTITKRDSHKCRQAIQDMGIRYLELEFIVELGSSNSDELSGLVFGYRPGRGRLNDLVRIEALKFGDDVGILTFARVDPEVDSQPLLLENVLSVKFDSSDAADGLTWCDGMRLRRAGHVKSLDKMYHRYGDLNETKQTPGQFREIKRDDALKLFLEDSKGKDIGGLMLRHFNMDSNSNQRRYPIMFQPATLIEVDRKGTDKKIELLRTLVPTLTRRFKEWQEEPEILRASLVDMMEDNRLFTALGLKSSDIFYQEKGYPEWLFLHDYAPDIVELMMLKPELINMYTWYSEFAWPSSQKQQGIDVVMEGCLHDIVRFVAGGEHPQRELVGEVTGVKNRYGNTFSVKWVDSNEDDDSRPRKNESLFVWPDQVMKGFLGHAIRSQHRATLTEVLRELPFLAPLMGMKKENADLLDILVRFNAFTSIERIDQPYLSSGQAQVLALITAVRSAKEGSLILVDEPEISLHVDWQERLVEQLHAPLTGSRLIIATHSPDIVVQHRHLCTVINSKEEGKFYRIE
jgi:ABC-type transport system involved in cytochrome c biogenesis ATPase subunit